MASRTVATGKRVYRLKLHGGRNAHLFRKGTVRAFCGVRIADASGVRVFLKSSRGLAAGRPWRSYTHDEDLLVRWSTAQEVSATMQTCPRCASAERRVEAPRSKVRPKS